MQEILPVTNVFYQDVLLLLLYTPICILDRNDNTSAYNSIIDDHTHVPSSRHLRCAGYLSLSKQRPANANRSPDHASSNANSRSSYPRFLQPNRNNKRV